MMHVLRAVASCCLALAFTVPAVAAVGQRIVLPGGTIVTVFVVDPISSATAHVGDTFAVRAKDDVVVNGWVAISKGAEGQGEVLSVEQAGKHGHPGTIGIQMDWIYAADGEKVRLTSQNKTQEGEGKAGESSTVTIISAVFLGIPGLFAHNFVKGKDITLDDTHPLQAFINDSVYIVAKDRAVASNAGFAKTVGGGARVSTPSPSPSPL
jgi:hypothetical protein